MTDRITFRPAVFTILMKGNQVLLLRRKNTGWMDGYYEPPAGHLEYGETLQEGAIREATEETGVTVQPQDLKLKHIYQTYTTTDGSYIGFMFTVSRWEGKPQIKENEKCDDMQFFPLDNLPDKVTPYVMAALESLEDDEITYSSHTEETLVALNSAAKKLKG